FATASGPGGRMEVDVVRHGIVGVVAESRLDQVTFANPNELAGRIVAERPVGVADAVREELGVLPDLDVEQYPGGVPARQRGWYVGRGGHHRALLAANLLEPGGRARRGERSRHVGICGKSGRNAAQRGGRAQSKMFHTSSPFDVVGNFMPSSRASVFLAQARRNPTAVV